MSVNRAFLLGFLTQDAKVNTLPDGTPVIKVGIATNESYKDKNGNKVNKAEFHNLVAFGTRFEGVAKYLSKGTQVYVEGKIQTRSWDKDGAKHYMTEINVGQFELLGKQSGQKENHPDQTKFDALLGDMRSSTKENIASDDIPF